MRALRCALNPSLPRINCFSPCISSCALDFGLRRRVHFHSSPFLCLCVLMCPSLDLNWFGTVLQDLQHLHVDMKLTCSTYIPASFCAVCCRWCATCPSTLHSTGTACSAASCFNYDPLTYLRLLLCCVADGVPPALQRCTPQGLPAVLHRVLTMIYLHTCVSFCVVLQMVCSLPFNAAQHRDCLQCCIVF